MYKFGIFIVAILLSLSPVAACSSVVGFDSFGFQRDSVDPANVTIENINGALVESKPGFVHSVVFSETEAFGIGGADNPFINDLIVKIGYLAHDTGIPQLIYLAAPLTWYTGGHFAYKDGNNVYYQTFVNGFNAGSATVEPGQYFIVSNDAICTGSYRASDVFSALSQSSFAAGHHRYAIEYHGLQFDIQNFQNESITI